MMIRICIILLFFGHFAAAQVRLPVIFRDSMILQRDAKINVWGWASAGEKISLTFKGRTYRSKADENGKWKTQLDASKAGGPFTLSITAKNKITLSEILIGDVWLCSGQSNMEHRMGIHEVLYAEEIANVNNPAIRQFKIPNKAGYSGPLDDLPGGSWKSANPTDIGQFSAVAYFFAKQIYEKYKVPIGIINASWGGSAVEAWMSEDALGSFEDLKNVVTKNKDSNYINDVFRKIAEATAADIKPADKGLSKESPWFQESYLPADWKTINLPGYWEDQGIKDLDGIVWYRREIEVPASMINRPAKIFLGRIIDADVLYINGQQVGTTSYMYPQRRYSLPSNLLRAGKNTFVIRVTNNAGRGGFIPDKPYQLIAGDTIDLKGTWLYKVGAAYPPRKSPLPAFPVPNQPTALYNSMIAPILQYNIRGITWYQGETNASNPELYAKLFPAFIKNWREKFHQGVLPFLFVQLPNFMDANYLPSESKWAETRFAQLNSLAVPKTAMAVTIDLGEWNDIHPDRKKEVGQRLALAAQKLSYLDSNLVTSGPLFASVLSDAKRFTVSFTNTGSGLMIKNGNELSEFAIAGADKKFVWAQAKIEGDKVIVWSDQVADPKYIRYAWGDNPPNPNLYNKEGLPASPFQAENK